jgi:endonuclease YncB( thermonuclease family)
MSRKTLRAGVAALLLIIGALFLILVDPTSAEPTSAGGAAARPAHWRVIDGDTFEDLDTGDRYRLENIDTPETGPRARCSAERELGDRATARARAFISSAQSLDVRRTGRIDRYDRIIAFVRIDGRDLGELMIAEGLARPWRGRREPWCDAGGNLIP